MGWNGNIDSGNGNEMLNWDWVGMGAGMILREYEVMGTIRVIPHTSMAHLSFALQASGSRATTVPTAVSRQRPRSRASPVEGTVPLLRSAAGRGL